MTLTTEPVRVLSTDDATKILHSLGIPATPITVALVAGILRQNRVVLVQLSPGSYANVAARKERLTLEAT
jgi:hypothetical protein